MGLTAEQIAKLLGETRTKGQYIGRLNQFIESGAGAVCVTEEWPADFNGKQANTIKQGFENAKNSKNRAEGSDNVKVIKNNDLVYLVNYGSDEVAEAAQAQAA